jgi:sulfur carrier protein ThiS adenylyltransferase
MHLVRSGIGKLVIADFDTVNESNLNRQFFFRDQVGRAKVEALKENLLRISPECDIKAVAVKLDSHNVREVFAGCNVVVEAFDSTEAKAMMAMAFAKGPVPLVTASGLAGWGRSNAIRLRRIGANIVAIGDGETAVSPETPPFSPRVGIAAAMEANAAISLVLGVEP